MLQFKSIHFLFKQTFSVTYGWNLHEFGKQQTFPTDFMAFIQWNNAFAFAFSYCCEMGFSNLSATIFTKNQAHGATAVKASSKYGTEEEIVAEWSKQIEPIN